jgi:hypothetical protein
MPMGKKDLTLYSVGVGVCYRTRAVYHVTYQIRDCGVRHGVAVARGADPRPARGLPWDEMGRKW